jgi:hypothetical protein
MRSTAQYIGVLGADGRMSSQNVWFAPGSDPEKPVEHYGTRLIGARQLPHERWVTTPLYQLSIDTNGGEIRQPIAIEVLREIDEVDPDDTFARMLEAEASKEQIKIQSAVDAAGRNARPRIILNFRTIGSDAYWLDTGIFRIP